MRMTGMGGMNNNTMNMSSSGIADGMIMGKYLLHADNILAPKEQWTGIFGATIPLGSIDKKDKNQNLLPYAMQLGSGTIDPFIGIQYGKNINPLWIGGTLKYKTPLENNKNGYRLGNEFKYDLYAIYQINPTFTFELLLEGKNTEKISGEVDTSISQTMGMYKNLNWDPTNTGSHVTFISAGIQWKPIDKLIIGLDYGVPIYESYNGMQLNNGSKIVLSALYELPTSGSKRHDSQK